MTSTTVHDDLYGALEAAASRDGRSVQELVNEAVESWLADAAADGHDHDELQRARAEFAQQGGVEFEAFFSELLEGDS